MNELYIKNSWATILIHHSYIFSFDVWPGRNLLQYFGLVLTLLPWQSWEWGYKAENKIGTVYIWPHQIGDTRDDKKDHHTDYVGDDRGDLDTLERVQQRATMMIKRMEHLSYGDRMRVWVAHPREEKLQRDFTVAFQYLKWVYRKAGEGFFITICSYSTRGNGFKLKDNRLRLDIGTNSSLCCWWGTWTGCPKKLWMPHPSSQVGWQACVLGVVAAHSSGVGSR